MTAFTQSQLEAIAHALGDTAEGLTGSEIAHLLHVATISDTDPQLTKRHRLLNAFAQSQNTRGDRRAILKFMRQAMKPERYLRDSHRYEPMRAKLNAALAFAGLMFDQSGTLGAADQVATLPEAERRARELRADLVLRNVHEDLLRFCRSELLLANHFHADLA